MFLHDCANAIWSLKGLEGPPFFCFGYFYSSKKINHIVKNASILYLKSCGCPRPSHFLTSTHSGHTSHHHGRPTIGGWFLTWKNTADLL
jgi:hypothetical protein